MSLLNKAIAYIYMEYPDIPLTHIRGLFVDDTTLCETFSIHPSHNAITIPTLAGLMVRCYRCGLLT